MIWLISFWDDELKQRIAFIVRADDRSQAKRRVKKFAEDSLWQLDPNTRIRSNLLGEGEIVRIDHLIN